MADVLMGIEMDTAAVLRALALAPAAVERALFPVTKDTADRIEREARRRVRVLSGATREGIVVEVATRGLGHVVIARKVEPRQGGGVKASRKNIPLWLEHGTANMTSKPFFDAAAAVERGPHLRRMADAADRALKGLG